MVAVVLMMVVEVLTMVVQVAMTVVDSLLKAMTEVIVTQVTMTEVVKAIWVC